MSKEKAQNRYLIAVDVGKTSDWSSTIVFDPYGKLVSVVEKEKHS
jgi:glycerol kinase